MNPCFMCVKGHGQAAGRRVTKQAPCFKPVVLGCSL
jgi:hypothetical protein